MDITTKFLQEADHELHKIYKHLRRSLPSKEYFAEQVRMSPGSPESEHGAEDPGNLSDRVSLSTLERREDVRKLMESGWGHLPIVEINYKKIMGKSFPENYRGNE